MTATAARRRPAQVGPWRAAIWRHPEWPLLVAAALAWAALAVDHWANHGTESAAFSFDGLGWALMVIAMMVPGLVPMARYVSFNSLWRRRHRAAALFTGAYVGVWVVLGLGASGLVAIATSTVDSDVTFDKPILAGAGAVAVAWQFTGAKHRALRRCHLRRPLGVRGWPADRAVLRYGIVHAWACVGSCGAIMAVMLVAQHDFHLMVPLAAVTIVERFQRAPRAFPGAIAIAVTVLLALA